MSEWKEYSAAQLEAIIADEKAKYEAFKTRGLKLDLSRGKPSSDVLDLSNVLLDAVDGYHTEDGTDIRNYGVVSGIPECKNLFSELLDIPAGQMILGGNSSLTHMYNVYAVLYLFGTGGHTPWSKQEKIKILCPCPGYDRHFAVTQDFGAEMIVVPLLQDGPDMDVVEALVAEDPAIKGIWCVPLYSNPTGCVYSEQTARRLAEMRTAAPDFRIFWDNAYGVHHVFDEHTAPNILRLAAAAGNPERVYYFFSTSKVNFPGAGIGLVASGLENVKELSAHLTRQTIGFDKIIQLKTVQFFDGSVDNIRAHMRKIAELLRPRFELVLETLDREFSGTDLLRWTSPKGGYFVSVDVPDGCAKRVVSLAKEAGAVLTNAGATYPYGRDPHDSNIRIAPTYPSLDELRQTMELFCICVRIAAFEKLLETK